MNVTLDKEEFVCIFARDAAYLNHNIPYNDWNYHNVRNSDRDCLAENESGFISLAQFCTSNYDWEFSLK